MTSKKPPKANRPPKVPPFAILRKARDMGIREVLVAYSGGKDSILTLELCSKVFDRVEAYFLYVVPWLSWEIEPIRWAENRYGIKVHQIPHPSLSKMFREATFRHGTMGATGCPLLHHRQAENYARELTGIDYIAAGERCNDSLERQAYIKHCQGIDHQRRRIYPIGFWREKDVVSYLAMNDIPTPRQYRFSEDQHFKERGKKNQQFGGFQIDTVAYIKQNMPADYEKIKELFPLIEAQAVRAEIYRQKEVVSSE
jgi:phosphoadenosine phosphosulfate reductase